MKQYLLSILLIASPLMASPYLVIGDSTMAMNCQIPGWLPKGTECRAVGGWSYDGYLRELSWGSCEQKDIVIGSAGLNAGLGFRPLIDVEAEFTDFMVNVHLLCPGSRIILVGINQTRIMSEETRQLFNAYASAFADVYIEPPFGIDSAPDGVHYNAKAAWALRRLIFTEDD